LRHGPITRTTGTAVCSSWGVRQTNKEKRQAYLKACEEVEKILLGEVERLKIDLVSNRELERIKKLNQRDFLDRMRSNEQLAGTLVTLEVQMGWRYLMTYLDKIAQVEQICPHE
jgi:predicted Zn-dependent peptidase